MIHLLVMAAARALNSNVAAGGSVCLLFHRHFLWRGEDWVKGDDTVRWKTVISFLFLISYILCTVSIVFILCTTSFNSCTCY
jgi:hypothetical protein